MTRIFISGRNSEIPANSFQIVGRGLASQGGSGCRHPSKTGNAHNHNTDALTGPPFSGGRQSLNDAPAANPGRWDLTEVAIYLVLAIIVAAASMLPIR